MYLHMKQIKSAVIGPNESRLDHIQTESGATITVCDAGSFYSTITISGTQEQINNARLLLRMWSVLYMYTLYSMVQKVVPRF